MSEIWSRFNKHSRRVSTELTQWRGRPVPFTAARAFYFSRL